jgi:hypothetical protein
MEELMNSVIFYDVSERCYHASKMTVKQKGIEVKTEIWFSSSGDDEPLCQIRKYWSDITAYRECKKLLGSAIIGGWKVLVVNPKKMTWDGMKDA